MKFEHGQEFLFLGKKLQLVIAEYSPREFESTEFSAHGYGLIKKK